MFKKLESTIFKTLSAAALIGMTLYPGDHAMGLTNASPDSTLQVILREIKGTPLTLEQAEQYAMKNATALRQAEATYLAARGSVRRAAGMFDPQLFFDLNYRDQELPTASLFSGAPTLQTKQTTSSAGLRMDLPIGTELELALNTVHTKTNSEFALLNPEYNLFGSFGIRQPLLRGFAASGRKQLVVAKHALEAAAARYEQQKLAVMSNTERMYWDLYAAERDYAVQKLSRDRAQSFYEETELRSRAGLVGPDQVANARTFLAQQELLLIDSEEQLDRRSDQLASLIGVRPEADFPRFIPTDDPSSDFTLEPVDILVERAIRNNNELKAARREVEAAHSLASAAAWEALPDVALVGSIAGNGLGGTPQEVVFNGDTVLTTRGGSFGDAFNQVTKGDYPNWSIGVEINMPIGLRSGRGEKNRLKAQALSAEQRFIEASRVLEEQVRAVYREVAHGMNRLAAANEGVDAAQEQVRIGLIEFHNGRSTAFELVRLSEDLAVAQQRHYEALVRTAKAAITLRELISESALSVNTK